MILPAIAWFFLVLAWDLYTDYRKWLKSRAVNHTKEAWIRAAILIPAGIGFTWNLPWWCGFAVVFLIGFWWLLLFNGIYNRLRGFDWWFKGSVDEDDSWFDRWIYTGRNTAQFIILSGVIISTGTYVALYFKYI